MVDSTLATPFGQQPIRHGVDLVLHSATKGIAGHNDATLGVVSGEQELLDDIWRYGILHGASASPFDAMLALRDSHTMCANSDRATRLSTLPCACVAFSDYGCALPRSSNIRNMIGRLRKCFASGRWCRFK